MTNRILLLQSIVGAFSLKKEHKPQRTIVAKQLRDEMKDAQRTAKFNAKLQTLRAKAA